MTGVIWTRTREDADYWLSRIVDVPGTPSLGTLPTSAEDDQYIELRAEATIGCTIDLPCSGVQIVVHDPYTSPTSCMPSAAHLCSPQPSVLAGTCLDGVGVSVDSQLDNNTYEVGLNISQSSTLSTPVLEQPKLITHICMADSEADSEWLGLFDLDGPNR